MFWVVLMYDLGAFKFFGFVFSVCGFVRGGFWQI